MEGTKHFISRPNIAGIGGGEKKTFKRQTRPQSFRLRKEIQTGRKGNDMTRFLCSGSGALTQFFCSSRVLQLGAVIGQSGSRRSSGPCTEVGILNQTLIAGFLRPTPRSTRSTPTTGRPTWTLAPPAPPSPSQSTMTTLT